jgi:hypothetical protein
MQTEGATLQSRFTCFAFFGTLTLLFFAFVVARRDLTAAQGAARSALLALLAYGAASHLRRRK